MDREKLEGNSLNTINCTNRQIKKYMLFYTIVFFSSIFVIPILGIIASTFIFSGIIIPIFGLIKLLGYIFNIDVPFVMFQIGNLELNPIISLVLSILVGKFLYVSGKFSWELLLKYIYKLKDTKKNLEKSNRNAI